MRSKSNVKPVSRIRREEGIKVSKKQRRMKRLQRPAGVQLWDFVADQTKNGSGFRILTLLDEHTQ
jgi:putative transposase